MSRPCGIHQGVARPWLVTIGGTALCWVPSLGRLTAAALFAAQAVLAAGEGPYGVIPEDYNLEELPTPSAPGGDAVQLEVGVDSVPYDYPKPDCIAGTIELPLRVRFYWYDPRLVFPQQVSNWTSVAGSSVSVDPGSIWTPDLEVAERMGEQFCSEGPVVLYDLAYSEKHHPGGHDIKYNVMWPRSCTMTTRCDCNLENFPFDENTCKVTWVPLAERGYKVVDAGNLPDKLSTKGPKVMESVEFTYWFFTDSSPTISYFDRITPKFHTLGEQQAVRNLIHFERSPEYFIVNFLCPTMMLVFMEWFTFFIPLDKSDRVAYGVTLLLANVATQFITADRRPPENKNTWIDLFSAVSLILIVYPVLVTVILLRFSAFLSRKVQNLRNVEKKQEYEAHVSGLISGVDRLGRTSYPIFVFAAYTHVFITPEYGSRTKAIELLHPFVMKLILFAFVIPTSICLMWSSIISLVSNGICMPDRAYVSELMWDREVDYSEDDSEEESLPLDVFRDDEKANV